MENQYIISDVSKILEIEPHVLRYWEEELSLKITRNQLGHRYYRQADLDILLKIKSLKDQGLQLKAIKVLLEAQREQAKESELKSEETQVLQNPPQAHINTQIVHSGEKLKQFQEFMKDIINNTLKENNEVIVDALHKEMKEDIKELVANQELLDEKHFRKLDESIREMQKMRQEVAVTKKKGWFANKKKG